MSVAEVIIACVFAFKDPNESDIEDLQISLSQLPSWLQLLQADWRCITRVTLGSCLCESLNLCCVSMHLIIAPSCPVISFEGCRPGT